MILLALSAGLVGLIHSLAPGHWLPVVLLAKSRKWGLRKAILGALVACSGHILISITLAALAIQMGSAYLAKLDLEKQEHQIEHYSGILLMIFGLIYSWVAYQRHSRCKGHTHHGPSLGPSLAKKEKGPYLFLFSLGLSPCVAVLPLFIAAAPFGILSLLLSVAAFIFGVVLALVGSTVLVSMGLMKLDHPLFEHFGDVMTGFCVSAMGIILFYL